MINQNFQANKMKTTHNGSSRKTITNNKCRYLNETRMIESKKIFSEDNFKSKIDDNDDECEESSDEELYLLKKPKKTINVNKIYKYNKNIDEEIAEINTNEQLVNSNVKVHDLRFFDFYNPSSSLNTVFIHNSNPNIDLIKMFVQMKSFFIFTEKTYEILNLPKYEEISNKINESQSFCILNNIEIEEKTNLNINPRMNDMSINESIVYNLEKGFKKSLKNINEESKASKNKRIIIYYETGVSDIEIFFLLVFYLKLKNSILITIKIFKRF